MNYRSALTADTSNFDRWPLCCDKSKLNENLIEDLGKKVDTNMICKRGICTWGYYDTSRNSSTPTTLMGKPTCGNSVLGSDFLRACKVNYNQYPDLKEQYFGSATGLLNTYPAGGVTDHSILEHASRDGYDATRKMWFVRSRYMTTRRDAVQFNVPYPDYDPKVSPVRMSVKASKAVISPKDQIFQGVIGIDMRLDFFLDVLKKRETDDTYYFVLSGWDPQDSVLANGATKGMVMYHPKLNQIPHFTSSSNNFIHYKHVESEVAFQKKIAEILGKEKGVFEMEMARYRSLRNEDVVDAVDASRWIKDPSDFFAPSWIKENIKASCMNLETGGAEVYFTVCAVKKDTDLRLRIIVPVFLVMLICILQLAKSVGIGGSEVKPVKDRTRGKAKNTGGHGQFALVEESSSMTSSGGSLSYTGSMQPELYQ